MDAMGKGLLCINNHRSAATPTMRPSRKRPTPSSMPFDLGEREITDHLVSGGASTVEVVKRRTSFLERSASERATPSSASLSHWDAR